MTKKKISWDEIPGNLNVFKKLVELLHTGEAVGFVGAGASAGLYPLWPKLIEQLADEAIKRGLATEPLKTVWSKMDSLQAARQIRRKLGEGEFSEFIRSTFGPRKSLDNKRYTSKHAALMRLGISRFVTTNYDPALSYACRDLCPGLSPEAFDWRGDRVGLWLQDRAGTGGELPILHAHGRHDAGQGIVLDSVDYRRAYSNKRYLKLFEQLWIRERLVVVGFSLQEAWLQVIVEQALTDADTRKVGARRHFAVLPMWTQDLEDPDIVAAKRDAIEEPYHLRALFYPVETITEDDGEEWDDHSALPELLEELVAARGKTDSSPTPAPSPKPEPLKTWLRHVQEEHSRIGGGFDRPRELRLLEQAWVQVMVQPAVDDAAPEDLQHELLREQKTLDEVLQFPVGKPSWNEGRWLLEGPPGSGKTTLLRRLAARLAEAEAPDRIPVFVSLPRLLESDQEILIHATDGLDLGGSSGIREALEFAGREGRLVLLLDSFDEVPRDRRKAALRQLRELKSGERRGCRLVISSRPIGRGDALDELPRLDLQPLTEPRRREFLETWLRHAGREKWKAEADTAMKYFEGRRSLRVLSGIPLYLTLLATLLEQGKRPSHNLAELYDQIFSLLLKGKHRDPPTPIQSPITVHEALRYLAYGMTAAGDVDLKAEELEERLREQRELCQRLGNVPQWRADLQTFLLDLYEKTQILGPHDGRQGDWKFWHRTFCEALTAERLQAIYEADEGPTAFLQWAQQLEEDQEGAWGEPLALLTGRLDTPDELVLRLGKANPRLAARSASLAQGLKPDTLIATLKLIEKPDDRALFFEGLPDQLGDPEACLDLVERLRQGCRNGFDLYWLWWILDEVERRWRRAPRAAELREHFFDHIPPLTDPELLWRLDSPLDGSVDLWREIPAGEGWVGSPETEEDRFNNEGPRHRVLIPAPFWLGAGPVTNAQYAAFDPDKPFQSWGDVPDDELPGHPRVNVTWYEAVSFCRWLGAQVGFDGSSPRLPLEEEWEVAARAGTNTRFWSGDETSDLEKVGWFDGKISSGTHPVASKPANEHGLYDIHGNVREWTVSPWDTERYQGRSPNQAYAVDSAAVTADLAAPPRVGRVVRGGGCWSTARWCRSAFRDLRHPRSEFWSQGFRVLLSSAPSRDSRR
ncbi:MAG: SUMF1/EgtB/PvdO family nonheme iron enzyme [Acidobacteriota bacterium]